MRVSSGKSLVDAITKVVGKLLPVPEADRVSDEEWNNLRQRYSTIDSVADFFCVGGMIIAAVLPRVLRDGTYRPWDIGVIFGLGVALPLLWLFSCSVMNFASVDELFRYSSAKHGINMRRIFLFFYFPIIIIGVACAVFAYR